MAGNDTVSRSDMINSLIEKLRDLDKTQGPEPNLPYGSQVTTPTKVPYFRISQVSPLISSNNDNKLTGLSTTIKNTVQDTQQLTISMDLKGVKDEYIVTLMFVIYYLMLLCDALITDPTSVRDGNKFQERLNPKIAAFQVPAMTATGGAAAATATAKKPTTNKNKKLDKLSIDKKQQKKKA